VSKPWTGGRAPLTIGLPQIDQGSTVHGEGRVDRETGQPTVRSDIFDCVFFLHINARWEVSPGLAHPKSWRTPDPWLPCIPLESERPVFFWSRRELSLARQRRGESFARCRDYQGRARNAVRFLGRGKSQVLWAAEYASRCSSRIALRVGDLSARGAVITTILHECGHLLAARSLGFPTGGIHPSPTEAGASIDLLLSLKTIDEVLDLNCAALVYLRKTNRQGCTTTSPRL
jgi:hypothetical protein